MIIEGLKNYGTLYKNVGFGAYSYWIVNLKPVFKRKHKI